MAKILAALCLLAILGASTSSPVLPDISTYFPWRVGNCETNGYTYMKEFDAEKFFNGTWHELMSFGTHLFQMDGKCPAFQSEVVGKDVNLLFYQYVDMLKKWVSVRGRADVDEMKGSRFVVQYDFLAGLANVKVPYSVMNTDYENYAVFYSCQEAYGMKLEMSWASTRVKGDMTFMPQIQETVEDAGLKMNKFSKNQSNGCDANEPSL